MVQHRLFILALLATTLPWLGAGPARLKTFQSKSCGFSLRYRPDCGWKRTGPCAYQLTFPEFKEAPWISEAYLTLEVSLKTKDPIAIPTPQEGEEAAGTLVAGGLKFERTIAMDFGAGQTVTTIRYRATGKKHRYQWIGSMHSTHPENLDKHVPGWDPAKSAQKIFDGILLGFRPLE